MDDGRRLAQASRSPGRTAASITAAVAAGHPLPVHCFDQWRVAARALLAQQVAPQAVQWRAHQDDGAPFAPDTEPEAASAVQAAGAALRIPRALMAMLQSAACCRVSNRWAFLYLVLWRWQQGEHAVLSTADPDGARLRAMVEAVRREEHDMHATIRFRERRQQAGPPRFVAWCEPAHDVLPQLATHFAKRMGRVTWMIASPETSFMWDGATLHGTGPLLRGPAGLGSTGEAHWLRYYRGIFHPARLHAELAQGPKGTRQPHQAPPPEAPATLEACRRCELWKNATQAVPGAGPPRARIMLVGEQPGDQEDLAGLPFVGPAGQLLERALAEAGLERHRLYLTNAVKHFKWEARGKRRMHKTPAQREIDACAYWLERELAQVQPQVIVALGSTALKAVTGNPHATLKAVLGHPFPHQGRWIVAVVHPSYALRVPGAESRQQAFDLIVAGLREAKRLAG